VKDHLPFLLFTKSAALPKSAVPGHYPPCRGPACNIPNVMSYVYRIDILTPETLHLDVYIRVSKRFCLRVT